MISLLRFSALAAGWLALLLGGGWLYSRAQPATPVAPTVTETAKLFDATIQRFGQFGRAVACTNETLVVGAPYDDTGGEYSDGAVSVYERAATGWQLRQKLALTNGWPNDNFGNAVALDGATLAVGARGANFPPNDPRTGNDTNEGAVRLYTRGNDGRWTPTQLFSANDVQDGDYFGDTVALDGDTLVVGNRPLALERRAAYVFTRTGGGWRQTQKLVCHGPLALRGETLAVQVVTGLEQTALHVYTRGGNGWTRRQELTGDPSATADGTGFGSALALNETTLAASAPHESGAAGRVYVFTRSGAGWVRQQKLAASDAAAGDEFGVGLALAGNTLAAGATYRSNSARQTAGTVYLFNRNGAAWTERLRLQASDGLRGDGFGMRVALAERVALVGALQHGRSGTFYLPGAAYVYDLASPPRTVVNVSAASYAGAPLAPASLAAAFGTGLATQTAVSASLPETLAGTSISVTDSAGVTRRGRLFFVSPTQLNYQIPPETARGAAQVTVTSGDGSVAQASLPIEPVAPGVFTADASGRGLAAAVALRVKADGAQSYEPVARFDPAQSKFVAAPLDVSRAGEQVFLILFGTGWRLHGGLSGIHATAGGAALDVSFAGAQGDLVGLDQLNLRLPPALAGRGALDIALTVNGQAANPVRIFVQ